MDEKEYLRQKADLDRRYDVLCRKDIMGMTKDAFSEYQRIESEIMAESRLLERKYRSPMYESEMAFTDYTFKDVTLEDKQKMIEGK